MSRHESQRSRDARPRGRGTWCVLAATLLLAAGGCSNDLDTQYGRSSGRYEPTSVNGLDVLAATFTDAGHQVLMRRVLITSSMDNVQTIVWFPNNYDAPSEEVCRWFDAWLASGEDRTLVYVGRNYHAGPFYWRKMTAHAPREQLTYYRDRVARRKPFQAPTDATEEMTCEWFAIQRHAGRLAERLGGPWSAGIDAARAEVYVSDEFESEFPSTELLTAGDETVVRRFDAPAWYDGKLIAISNGSFLLNMALVNRENRKLAGKLIESVGSGERVVFLQSGLDGPPIDPDPAGSALARLFGAWPLNVILLHSAVLGIIFCFARWPIFGRPKVPPTETTSNFAHHVEAVGKLLARSRDRDYAISKLPDDPEAAKADAAGVRA